MKKITLIILSAAIMLIANDTTNVADRVLVSTTDSINTEKQAARDKARESKLEKRAAERLAKTEARELKLKKLNAMLLQKAELRNLVPQA